MKVNAVLLSAALAALAGCEPDSVTQTSDLDTRLVQALQQPPEDNAIVAQHTLFPYHFVPDSEKLNELGQRDMEVLACHFKNKTGRINVYRGDTPEALYEARLTTVIRALGACAISTKTVTVEDGVAGGEGVSADRAVLILDRDKQPMIVPDSAVGGSGTGGSGGAGASSTGGHP